LYNIANKTGELTTAAVEITGNARAQMKWANYWDAVVKTYRVVIEGWPSKILFAPLTQACSGVGDTQILLKSWTDGTTHWRQLSNEEFVEEEMNREAQMASGEIPGQCVQKTHEDKGKKRGSKHGQLMSSKRAQSPISKEYVNDDSDKENDGEEPDDGQQLRSTTSLMQVQSSNVNSSLVSVGTSTGLLAVSLQASLWDSHTTLGGAFTEQNLTAPVGMPFASSEHSMGLNGTGALSLTEELRAALGTSDGNPSQAFLAYDYNVHNVSTYNFRPMDLSNNSILPPGYIPPSSL